MFILRVVLTSFLWRIGGAGVLDWRSSLLVFLRDSCVVACSAFSALRSVSGPLRVTLFLLFIPGTCLYCTFLGRTSTCDAQPGRTRRRRSRPGAGPSTDADKGLSAPGQRTVPQWNHRLQSPAVTLDLVAVE